MNKIRTAITSFVLASSLVMGGSALAETLRVGLTCTYHPFNYKEPDGTPAGYDVDVSTEVAKRIGMETEYVCQAFDGLIPALLANKFDVIVSSMSITPSRMEQIDFTGPYRISVGRLIGRKDQDLKLFNDDDTVNPEGFKGIKVGIPRASTYEKWINAVVPSADVLLYDGPDPMFLDLTNGRVDVIMTNPMSAHLEFLDTKDGQDFDFVSPAMTEVEYFGVGVGIGVREGNPELVAKLNGAIKEMIEDGTLTEFSLKYFPFPIHPEAWIEVTN